MNPKFPEFFLIAEEPRPGPSRTWIRTLLFELQPNLLKFLGTVKNNATYEPTLFIETRRGYTPKRDIEKNYFVCYLTFRKKRNLKLLSPPPCPPPSRGREFWLSSIFPLPWREGSGEGDKKRNFLYNPVMR
jgi:hypothetical protein